MLKRLHANDRCRIPPSEGSEYLRIFHLDYLEVVSKRVEQVKALAIRHRDSFEDFCSLLFQIGSDGVYAFNLDSEVTIFRRLGPGRCEINMQQHVHPFIPDQVIDLVESVRPLHFLQTKDAAVKSSHLLVLARGHSKCYVVDASILDFHGFGLSSRGLIEL